MTAKKSAANKLKDALHAATKHRVGTVTKTSEFGAVRTFVPDGQRAGRPSRKMPRQRAIEEAEAAFARLEHETAVATLREIAKIAGLPDPVKSKAAKAGTKARQTKKARIVAEYTRQSGGKKNSRDVAGLIAKTLGVSSNHVRKTKRAHRTR